jgi:hypothetical protein
VTPPRIGPRGRIAATALLSTGFVLAGSTRAPRPGGPRFAVVTLASDGTGCLAARGWTPAAGDSVLIAPLEPAVAMVGVVERVLPGPCRERLGVLGDDVSTCAVRVIPRGSSEPGLWIAAWAPGSAASVDSSGVVLRVPGETEIYTFRYCASYEGIHLTAWRGAHRVWHEYYYLGYEVEPDCPDDTAYVGTGG